MKKLIAAAALAAVLIATGCAASSGQSSASSDASQASSSTEAASSSAEQEGATYSIEVSAPADQPGEWRTDDPAFQENNIVKLVSSGLEGGKFVATYEPVNDGSTSVNLMHYTGPACDMFYTYILTVENGQIKEEGEPYLTQAPDADVIDPFISGDWVEDETQFSTLNVEKNAEGGWSAEAVTAATHSGHVFKMNLYYDCDLQKLMYSDGAMYDVPITDSEDGELGDPVATDMQGAIEIASTDDGKVALYWNSEANSEDRDITFVRIDGAGADYADFQEAVLGIPAAEPNDANGEEVAPDESADEAAQEGDADAEDGQNPVMNFVGEYVCDRAIMKVEAAGSQDALITIDWGSSADSNAEWVIRGYFDTDKLTVNYQDAVKTAYVYNPDGSVKSEEVEYSDGAGHIIFHDNPISCTWQNETEPDNGAMEFTWNY